MHLKGADLHLEGAPLVHHGGVQRLVHVGLGHADVVLEATRHLGPYGVDDAQGEVAVLLGVHQDAHGDQVHDLVEGLVLGLHLFIDGVEVLRATVDLALDARLGEPGLQLLGHLGDQLLPLLPLHAHQAHQLIVALGIDVAQGQVLQLPLDGVHAQPVRQRRVDVQRLTGDGHLALGLLVLQRAHIVQPIRQLDQHHANVLGHGQEHLAQGLRLSLLAVGEVQLAQLGHAVHQQGHLVAKQLPDAVQRAALHILHAVVQQPRGDGRRVQHQVCEDHRHGHRMAEIGVAGLAHLVGVGLFCVFIGPLYQAHVVVRVILSDAPDQLFRADIGLHGRIRHL